MSIETPWHPQLSNRYQQKIALQWRHNDHGGVSNRQPHGSLLNRLFRRRSKKHQSSASLAFVFGIHRSRWIPHTKGQLRGIFFPFDDIIMDTIESRCDTSHIRRYHTCPIVSRGCGSCLWIALDVLVMDIHNPFMYCATSQYLFTASWSGGRVQDSGLGSRPSSGFNTLPVRLLVVPLSKALHAALLLSTQEEMGTCEGRFVSRGAKLRVSGCILPRELRWLSRRIWTVKGPMTREGTCQSLQSRALSLDVDSK